MTTKVLRKIVRIDEDKCNGCGVCVPACVENALQIIDGKARLISEKYCDGLGACLGECPQDAIIVEEREAEEFDEEAVAQLTREEEPVTDRLPCGCPSSAVAEFEIQEGAEADTCPEVYQQSMLRHWPVQLTLVPPGAPFLKEADLILVADCVPFAYAGFHNDFLKGHAVLVACPKLDDFQAHQRKLLDIISRATSFYLDSSIIKILNVPLDFQLYCMFFYKFSKANSLNFSFNCYSCVLSHN